MKPVVVPPEDLPTDEELRTLHHELDLLCALALVRVHSTAPRALGTVAPEPPPQASRTRRGRRR